MEELVEMFWAVLGIWWLAVVPGFFLFSCFESISDLIEAKAREIRMRSRA